MPWLPKKPVVVPIDFSDESFAAVDAGLEMVADPSHLHLVHVLPILAPTEPGIIWNSIDDAGRVEHAKQAVSERLSDEKYFGAHVKILFGDPGKEITEYAQQQRAELIVLPSHGRTGFNRLLIGSVAERVVRLAHCPVLVLRK